MKKVASILGFIGLSFLLVACSNNNGSANDKSSQPMTDTVITTKVKSALALNHLTKSSSITVDTTDGVVSLGGVVDTRKGAESAVETAAKIEGVKDVNTDNLSVRNSKATMTDSYITAKVKGALLKEEAMHDIHLGVSHIKVETRAGVVYLDGKVKTEAQRSRVVDIANSIKGVSNVVDKLKIMK